MLTPPESLPVILVGEETLLCGLCQYHLEILR
jgi:hypothetical protein